MNDDDNDDDDGQTSMGIFLKMHYPIDTYMRINLL